MVVKDIDASSHSKEEKATEFSTHKLLEELKPSLKKLKTPEDMQFYKHPLCLRRSKQHTMSKTITYIRTWTIIV